MAGELGDLPGGWPEPFRTKVLEGRDVKHRRRPSSPTTSAPALEGDSRRRAARRSTALLFPAPTRQFEQIRELFGDLSIVDTIDYLYGLRPGVEHVVEIAKGVDLYVGLEAIGEADDKGMRTVMTTLNGQLRPVFVRDRSIDVETKCGREGRRRRSPARSPRRSPASSRCRSRRAPTVAAGQAVASIEAMKMEAAITSPVAGVVERLAIPKTQQVDAGDLLVVVRAR